MMISSCYGLLALLTIFSISDKKTYLVTSDTEFLKRSCEMTMYPQACFKSLSSYASMVQNSSIQLAQVALSVSLTSTQSASNTVVRLSKVNDIKPSEAAAILDCVETMGNSVDELQQSLEQMKNLGGHDFDSEMSDIQTWVSAALTNQDTCMDGFDGNNMIENIKDTIRSSIVNVAQLTSIALAFINSLSSTQANSP